MLYISGVECHNQAPVGINTDLYDHIKRPYSKPRNYITV